MVRVQKALSGRLWFDRDFRLFWAGETTSQLGTQITTLALPLVAVLTIEASATEIGLLGVAQFLPILLVTPLAGIMVDRRAKRPIMIVANLVRAVAILMVPLCALLGWLNIGALWAVAFLLGSLTALFDIAFYAFVPTLVQPDKLVEANSKLQATYSIAQVAGPGAGSLLVRGVGAPGAVVIDGLSYVLATICLLGIRTRETVAPREEGSASGPAALWRETREGLAFVKRDRRLFSLMWEAAWYNLFEQMVMTVYLIYAIRTLGLSVTDLGLTLVIGGAGAVLATLVARPLGRRLGTGPTIVWSIGLSSLCFVLIPLAPGDSPLVLLWLCAAFVLYGLGLTTFNVHAVSLRQTITPGSLLGRVTASVRFVSYGTIPLGAFLGGLLGDLIGLHLTLVLACVGLGAGWVVFALGPVFRVRTADGT